MFETFCSLCFKGQILQMENIVFETFYENILKKAVERLEENIDVKASCFSGTIYSDYSLHLAEQLQFICLRSLIAQMHYYKQMGKLKGNNPEEEYEFFCREIVGSRQFSEKLFAMFPVLKKCVERKIQQTTAFYTELINAFQKDRENIRRKLCPGADKITRIWGNFSDIHNNGKQVLRIQLDDIYEILYKPHSMENEKGYSELLRYISERTGISQLEYPFLSFADHSWCSIVAYKDCHTQSELENYYIRLGVQIFLTYYLGTKDLHCENVIASGEYPVLIDLETLVNIRRNQERKTVREEIFYQLSQSVLYSGLLPFYHWNKDGKGVDHSGISGSGGQRYPFKIPVIVKARTSDMRIEYQYPVSKKAQNLAVLEGEFYEPYLYKKQILYGFICAYRQVLAHKNIFWDLLKPLAQNKSRYLIADTQRYSMLLSSSYHPSLLMREGEREKFLDLLWQGRNAEDGAVVKSEKLGLLNGDIPYFYDSLNETRLFTAQGSEILGDARRGKPYFTQSAMEILSERMEMLNETDMKKQCDFIEVSLDLMPGDEKRYRNHVYLAKEKDYKKEIKREDIFENIRVLKNRLIDNAVWNKDRTEVSGYTLELSSFGKTTWDIRPMNMYLYDGLAGILLILYALEFFDPDKQISYMRKVLEWTLFRYTDECVSTPDKLQSKNTGAFNGESSIVYTYLALYQLSGDGAYLDYAKRHIQILDKLVDEDKNDDILSGNAGAAQVLLKMYDMSNDGRYLDMAIRAIGVLEKSAIGQKKGTGWPVKENMPPMAGMAHGNSGILLPVAALWKITGEDKYEKLAEQIWQYEEYLYDVRINNWTDVRSREERMDDIGPVAWCHGAGGVLLSRLKCFENLQNDKWRERFEKDVSRALKKLEQYWKRDSWSLCHGICGNLMILERATGTAIWPESKISLLPQEKINPGLMNGYGGILYFLLKRENHTLPDILGLD